jgi:hypothetical protein
MPKEEDYLKILDAIADLNIEPGRKILIDYLQGNKTDPVLKCRLHKEPCFGSMAYSADELSSMIDFQIPEGQDKRAQHP